MGDKTQGFVIVNVDEAGSEDQTFCVVRGFT
jgi:hypothetical protein